MFRSLKYCAPKLMQLRGVFVFCGAVLVFVSGSAHATAPSSISTLSRSPKWLKLLHYIQKGKGYESDAISPEFYLSNHGRADPEAELIALVDELKRSPNEIRGDDNAVCRFPARTRWTAEQFALRIPPSRCAQFEKFKKSLSARKVSVVFSSYYLNNPSSAFGHTFLRLGRGPANDQSEKADLLDYGINYAAIQTSNNAVIYALSGALGWFRGSFTKLPFYYKVREYGDFESRDLWFYNLDLSQAQVDELVRHIWELGQTQFDYYFFSTNCSYQLMAALEAVQPEWNFLDRLGHFVIPAETVKALWETPHLVMSVTYRPSNRKRLEARLQTLSPSATQIFKGMIGKKSPELLPTTLPLSERRDILDATIDYYDFKFAKSLIEGDSAASQEKQRFLIARSSLETESPEQTIAVPTDKEPHLGHGSSRFGLAQGYGSELKSFTELSYRAAFHDLLDPEEGYPDYAEIQVLDFGVRMYEGPLKVKLEKAMLVENSSLTPFHSYSYPLSWRMDAGLDRLKEKDCPDCMAGQLQLAGGATIEPLPKRFYSYLLINTETTWATSFPQSKIRLGIGPVLGLRIQPAQHFALVSETSGEYLISFSPNNLWKTQLDLRYNPGVSYSFGASYALTNLETEYSLSLRAYF